VTTRAATGLWAPAETIQNIGGALRAHWVAAKQVAAKNPFIRRSQSSWLEVSRRLSKDDLSVAHHLTMGGRLIK
jgi:hypothetical protein